MVQGRKPDLKRRKRIARLRARGLTLLAIGRALGVSSQCVHETLRRMESPRVLSVACCKCGRVIVSAGALPRDRGTALCIPCLAERPRAPLGQRLKAFRLAAGLTLASLADLAGVFPTALRKYEDGELQPRRRNITRLAKALGVELEALGFEGPPMPVLPEPPVASNRHQPRKSG
jgi:lambda repressor-like predicted transcriptional regulator